MSSVITTLGRTRMNELAGEETGLIIDRMVLAMVPGLDTSAAADPDQQLPAEEHIVYTYEIPDDYKGYVNTDQVVYSMMLGSDIGEFSFNWIGLLEKDTGTVITVTETPESSKWATDLATNTTGNMVTRNVILSYQDAQNLTGITVAAETWQFDYQAAMNTHLISIVDPTQEGTDPKHLTNTQGKKWEDHGNDNSIHLTPEQKAIWDNHAASKENPHNVLPEQIGYTAADVLAKLKTVDGYGTGLDADLLDGKHASSFALAANAFSGVVTLRATRTTTGTWSITGLTIGKPLYITAQYANSFLYTVSSGTAENTSSGRWGLSAINAEWASVSSFIIIPNAATVSLYISSGSGKINAYQ